MLAFGAGFAYARQVLASRKVWGVSYNENPINALPPVVILLALAMALPEIASLVGENRLFGGPGSVGWRTEGLNRFAFYPGVLDQMIDRNLWPLEHVIRIGTYPFVHGTFTHAIFAMVFVLALGKMVGEQMSGLAVLVLFIGASVFGALVYWLVLNDDFPLFGGMPGAYGLIGGYTFILWVRLVAVGGQQAQAFSLIAFLMGIQLLFGLIFDIRNDWVADLAGFFAGFGLSFLVVPGGFARLRHWLRNRR